MRSSLYFIVFALLGAGAQLSFAEAARPEDERLTGRVQDTTVDPFLKLGDGTILGDPFPVFWDGVWRLYTMDSKSESVQQFTSTDLVKWVEHKPAMVGHDICTGAVVRHMNKYYLFFTDCSQQTIRFVVSDNPWEFDFNKSRVAAEADGKVYNKGWFRDAYVFFNDDEKLWWMLIEGRCPEVCTGLFKSDDLIEWRECDPIFKDAARNYGSCPQIFKDGDFWRLALQDMGDFYYASKNSYGPWTNRGQYLSLVVEAASRFATDGKRQIAWGWLCDCLVKPKPEIRSYGGPLSVGREMVFKEDGVMGIRPLPELLAAIHKKENKVDFGVARKLSGQWEIDADRRSLNCTSENGGKLLLDLPENNPNCYFEAELEFGSPRTNANIVVRSSDAIDRGYGFIFNPADKKIAIRDLSKHSDAEALNDKEHSFQGKNNVVFQIFICDDYMEAFVDGQVCLSARTVENSCHKAAIELTGGSGIIRNPFLHYFRSKEEK